MSSNILDIEEVDAGAVNVGERGQAIYGYDVNGSKFEVGHVSSRRYVGESAQRHFFTPVGGKPTPMGVTTDRFRTIDHAETLEPLLAQGWALRDVDYGRGGQTMFAVMEHPEGRRVIDPLAKLNWVGDDSYLTESIVIRTGIRPGSSARYTRGIFRSICSNGLEVALTRVGRVQITHANWGKKPLSALLASLAPIDLDNPWGEYIGEARGVTRLVELLGQLQEEDWLERRLRLPVFIREQLTSIEAQPRWFQSGLAQRVKLLQDETEQVRALHLTNLTTDVVNHYGRERDRVRVMARVEPLNRSLASLIGAFSLN